MANFVNIPNILWKIENFSSESKKLSPSIRLLGLKFNLSTYQYMEAGNVKLQLILECQNAFQELPPSQFNIEVSILRKSSVRHMLKAGGYNLGHEQWCIWSEFVSNIHQSLGQIKDITFLIVITPSGEFGRLFDIQESDVEAKYRSPSSLSLGTDIGNLFNNAEHSDFTLKCGNRSFLVHKAILCARSQFFAGMFRCDMKESNDKEGTVENIEPDIMELVLRYLYTGEISQLPMETLRKVYGAADRLIVEPLKFKCQSLLVDSITSGSKDNSETVMRNEQPQIEKQSEKIEETNDIKEHQMLKDLFMSREWRLFSQEFPDRAHEMCKVYLM